MKPHFIGSQTFNQSFDDKYGVMTPTSPIFNKSMNNTGRNCKALYDFNIFVLMLASNC
jgi:hypothetical protein